MRDPTKGEGRLFGLVLILSDSCDLCHVDLGMLPVVLVSYR